MLFNMNYLIYKFTPIIRMKEERCGKMAKNIYQIWCNFLCTFNFQRSKDSPLIRQMILIYHNIAVFSIWIALHINTVHLTPPVDVGCHHGLHHHTFPHPALLDLANFATINKCLNLFPCNICVILFLFRMKSEYSFRKYLNVFTLIRS